MSGENDPSSELEFYVEEPEWERVRGLKMRISRIMYCQLRLAEASNDLKQKQTAHELITSFKSIHPKQRQEVIEALNIAKANYQDKRAALDETLPLAEPAPLGTRFAITAGRLITDNPLPICTLSKAGHNKGAYVVIGQLNPHPGQVEPPTFVADWVKAGGNGDVFAVDFEAELWCHLNPATYDYRLIKVEDVDRLPNRVKPAADLS